MAQTSPIIVISHTQDLGTAAAAASTTLTLTSVSEVEVGDICHVTPTSAFSATEGISFYALPVTTAGQIPLVFSNEGAGVNLASQVYNIVVLNRFRNTGRFDAIVSS